MRTDLNQQPVWTGAAAVFLLWTSVLVLGLSGLAMLTVHGDTGALLLIAALIAAAPAAALSQRRSSI
ncbi:hypothetical protein AB6V29_13620 [Microbacterium sp. 20-116]|uniref:hypothetical protein n=1 Tax=unclassified Microbacterium TaxID=2609290 RepID=UPI002271E9A1|nr:hypothetical protein [Microbacterium sp. SL75]WAC70349.1 hypothetical protein OVA17_06545 [Microbacterium sp. SL75]